jgi:hypothetical protein
MRSFEKAAATAAPPYPVGLKSAQVQAAPAAPYSIEAASAAAQPAVKGIQLPSSLPVISSIEAHRILLALDARGTLFLSRDSGRQWEQVPAQWSGHAMKLRISDTPSGATSSDKAEEAEAAPVAKAKKSPLPAPLFEIVNDGGATWQSADGKTWTSKTGAPKN